MKKLKMISMLLLVLALCCSFCGCSGSGAKSLNYKEYHIGNITYEIPQDFAESFSVRKNDGFNEELQKFYLETDIFNVLKGTTPNLKLDKKETCNGYDVYKYVDTVAINGEQTSIDVAAFGYNNSIYTFLFVWEGDYAGQRVEIYTHFLNSLK